MNERLNRSVKSAEKYGETWRERHQNIIKDIDKKLSRVREFSKIIETIEDGKLSGPDAQKLFAQMQEDVEKEIPQGLVEDFKMIIKNQERVLLLGHELDALEGQDSPNYEEIKVKDDELNPLIAQRNDFIESHPELNFAFSISFALAHIKRAMEKIEVYKDSQEIMLQDLASIWNVKNFEQLKRELKIQNVVFTPVSANIVLEKGVGINVLAQNGPNIVDDEEYTTYGLHARGGFVNVINGGQSTEEISATVKHEIDHIMQDAFSMQFGSLGPPISQLNMVFDPRLMAAFSKEYTRRIIKNENGRFGPVRMFDDSHYEIMSSLVESPQVIDYLKSTQNVLFALPISNKELNDLIRLLATAGIQISEVASLLQKGATSENLELSKVCKDTRMRYLRLIKRSLSEVGHAFKLADRFGEVAKRDVILLTYLLKPSQWEHIPIFLSSIYNK